MGRDEVHPSIRLYSPFVVFACSRNRSELPSVKIFLAKAEPMRGRIALQKDFPHTVGRQCEIDGRAYGLGGGVGRPLGADEDLGVGVGLGV